MACHGADPGGCICVSARCTGDRSLGAPGGRLAVFEARVRFRGAPA
jgi:hypothetical protein